MNNTQLNFENARIGFKNFEGREGLYNKKGDRSFSIFLSEEDAIALDKDGWNVKWPKLRPDLDEEEDNRSPTLQVGVSFDYYPAKVYLVTPRSDGEPSVASIGEDEVGMLDWAEIQNVDLVIRPYNWTVSGKSGVKAYLKAGYFTLVTDDFAQKYGL